MDLLLMKARLKDATLQYCTARQSHQESRLHFIETFGSKHRDRILRTEEQRRQGRTTRAINGKLSQGSVHRILHPQVSHGIEVLDECDTKATMELALLSANAAKYQQCDASPFLHHYYLKD